MNVTNETGSIDLSRLGLTSGGGRRVEAELQLAEIKHGGQRYEVRDAPTTARLDVSRTASGWAIRLRLDPTVSGPCGRCLEAARMELVIDTREVDEAGSADEELQSPYVEDEILNLDSWARDALALAMPAKYLCRPDCAGLCPVCGEPLGDADSDAHSRQPSPDPRWERLGDVKFG